MARRTPGDARRWMAQGTKLFAAAVEGLTEEDYGEPTALAGWTRRHLVAHVAANADAIGNLVRWAATGEETPMYSSPEQRNADIEAGSKLTGSALTEWFKQSAHRLESGMDALREEAWQVQVVTAQGRTVPASETPWMRAREVLVHAVDLGTGIGFADLPGDFLAALCDDIVAKRGAAAGTAAAGPALEVEASDTGDRWEVAGTGEPVSVVGSLAGVTSYLAGRGGAGVTTAGAATVPELPAWL